MTQDARKAKTRLVALNLVLFLLLLVFTVSFPQIEAVPAFGGDESSEYIQRRTPSLFDFLWKNPDLPKKVFKLGFPLAEHYENVRWDAGESSHWVLKYFLGSSSTGLADLALGQLPGYATEKVLKVTADYGDRLEDDWHICPVLFQIQDGTAVSPVNLDGGGSPFVAVYHTHATESYLPEVKKTSPGDAFCEDLSKTVVKCGEYFIEEMEQRYKIPCLHSKTVHDQEGRVGAYYRSGETVNKIKEKYPDCAYYLDIHRDSQRASLTKVTIKGRTYARLLLVVATNNPGWASNYSLAREVVSLLEEEYPGVTRGIMYQSQIYNQDVSPNALLVEVGGVDNDLQECRNSMEVLAWALASVMLPSQPKTP